jgi:prophage regulatory protein
MGFANNTQSTVLWRKDKVLEKTGLKLSTLYRLEKKGDFPQRVQLGPGSVSWVSTEVEQWIEQRMNARNERS